MKIGVISLFPKAFDIYQDSEAFGLAGKYAAEGDYLKIFTENLKNFGEGKHKVIDDSPYGGGDGMLIKAEPVERALESLCKQMELEADEVYKVFLSPSGKLWTQSKAEKAVKKYKEKGIVLLSGRYAGVDQRVIDKCFDEVISIGPYILNGGELPALVMIESLLRLLPGALGNEESALKDSFSTEAFGVEAFSYTRPADWQGQRVPDILLSGDHKRIDAFREAQSKDLSKKLYLDWFESIKDSFRQNYKSIIHTIDQ